MRRKTYGSIELPFLIKGKTVEPGQIVQLYVYGGSLYKNNFVSTTSDENCEFRIDAESVKITHIQLDNNVIIALMLGYINVTIPNDNRQNIKEITLGQNVCDLGSVEINPDFRLRFMCHRCENLEKFIAPNILHGYRYWDNPQQAFLSGMFYQCPKLKYIDLSGLKVPELKAEPTDQYAICPFSLFTEISKVRSKEYYAVLGDDLICTYDDLTIRCPRNLKAYNEVALSKSNVNWIFVD